MKKEENTTQKKNVNAFAHRRKNNTKETMSMHLHTEEKTTQKKQCQCICTTPPTVYRLPFRVHGCFKQHLVFLVALLFQQSCHVHLVQAVGLVAGHVNGFD